jgi:hypothetical protein
MICLNGVVRIPLNGLQRGKDQLVEDPWMDRGAISHDLARAQ